jgi:PAS domain S-box-containing protein
MAVEVIKVLHVDDEEGIVELTKEFLALDGIESTTATDPREAKRLAEEGDFDVLISDYQMPGMDGLELLGALRGDGVRIPFILFTGKGREDVAIRALNGGADFYVQKGGDPRAQFAELSNMVRACSERTRQLRLITRFTDMVNNVQSGLMAFRLEPDGGHLTLDMANPRAKKLMRALQGQDGDRLHSIVPGLFTEAERLQLIELAKGRGETLKAQWQGVLGGKTRHLQMEAFPLPGGMVGMIVNEVTAMARAEQRMMWAEEKFRSFFHTGYFPMLLVDNETKEIVEVNDRLCDFYGYRREELVGRLATIVSAEPEATLRTLDKVREVGLKVVHTRYHRHRDGTVIPVQIISGRMVSEGRDLATGIVIDIRERLESEAKLRSLSSAVENSPVTIMITDARGSIVYVNPKFTTLTGYTSEEVVGMNPRALSSGRNPRALYSDMWSTLVAGNTWKGVFANRKKNGELYWESASISPIRGEHGEVVNYVAVKEDITEAKALADQNARLSEMVTRAGNEIYSFHPETLRFEFVNKSALANLGYSMEEMGTMDPLDLKKDIFPKDFHELLEQLRSGRKAMVLFETTHRRKDGTVYPVEVHLQLVGREGEKRFLAIIMDITDRRRMEADLQRHNEKSRVLGALTRHDIMNQMSVLLGNLEMIEPRNDRDGGRIRASIKAAEQIRRYVEFSDDFSKTGSVSPVWHDLRKVISASWTAMGNGSVEVAFDVPPLRVLADSMFPKVFDNLFSNSLRHAKDLSKITISWREQEGTGIIVYVDDGPGISDKARSDLFNRPVTGTKGLGLFLVREVLKVTGMDMRECGREGEGVSFEIPIPADNWRK